MQAEFRRVDWPFASTFRIAYRTQTHAETVRVELKDGNCAGRGEALGVQYLGESIDSIMAQLAAVKDLLVKGITRTELLEVLPPGGARNAIDCALWDMEAKRAGRRAWELAGFTSIEPLNTAYTLSNDEPDAMARAAAAATQYSFLKLKLSGVGDVERVRAVRGARKDVRIIVDANQSWNEDQLFDFTPQLAKLGVKLIEQPLQVGNDHALERFKSAVPLCADESCQSTESLGSLVGKYQYVNIKLDKTGGLTEALRLARAAQRANLQLMVGCMAGSSLSMAPGFIIGQLCTVVDLDGPLLSTSDVANGIHYEGCRMSAPEAGLWG